jgi:hypothetical protein
MRIERRGFLVFLSRLIGLISLFLLQLRRQATGAPTWTVGTASSGDAPLLVSIFNAHLTGDLCPYSLETPQWTPENAQGFLQLYNGTVILYRDGVAAGFAGLIDYDNPATVSTREPDAVPRIDLFALDPVQLQGDEVVVAAKTLGAEVGRRLQAAGCTTCRARTKMDTIFDGWYEDHCSLQKVRKKDGIDHAKEVTFDIAAGLAKLAAEGY